MVHEYCGHGIGQIYHDEPQVLHYGQRGEGLKLEAGMVFTIEPMLNAGKRETRQLPDGWTVVTKDRPLSAQWEHMVAVTPEGHEVLTTWPESTKADVQTWPSSGFYLPRGCSGRKNWRVFTGLAKLLYNCI